MLVSGSSADPAPERSDTAESFRTAQSTPTAETPASPSDAKLQFYPGYLDPAGGWALQSNEGICFRINQADYAHWSTFFKDIADLHAAGASASDSDAPRAPGGDPVLPFPDVSTPALKFIVDAVNWIVDYAKANKQPLPDPADKKKHDSFKKYPLPTRPVLPMHTDGSGDIAVVEEIVYFANAYEMAIVLGPLFEAAKRQHFHPSILFALCALRGDGNFGYWVSRLVDKGQQGLHPMAVELLHRHAPEHYDPLLRLFDVWEASFADLCAELKKIPYDRADKSFGRRCRNRMELDRHVPCPVVTKYNHDFIAFLNDILPQALKYARENPQMMGTPVFLRWVANQVPCQYCARRVGVDVNVAWGKHRLRTSWHLSADPSKWTRLPPNKAAPVASWEDFRIEPPAPGTVPKPKPHPTPIREVLAATNPDNPWGSRRFETAIASHPHGRKPRARGRGHGPAQPSPDASCITM